MRSRSVSSRWRAGAATAAVIVAMVSALAADAAPKKVEKTGGAAKPNLVASFGDWNVFVGQAGKGKICYALAQPKSREPAATKRDAGYAFISDRPAEGVRNEVSFIMGFDVAGGAATADKLEKADKADSKPSKAKAKAEAKGKTKAEAKGKAAPVATVGEETFDLLPKGANLWVKNAARESALIAEMKKGVTLEVVAAGAKGGDTTDSYSLSGFSQAMDRLAKECPGKG
jgi:invasion protein IalB